MIFAPLYLYFKDEKISIFRIYDKYNVPLGEYGFLENYCADKDCDCRKVIINIADRKNPDKILATIGYGWEPLSFYEKWFYGEKEFAKEMVGAHLELHGVQSNYASEFLKVFKEIIKNEPDFVEEIKKHYKMFKDKLKSENGYFEDDHSVIKSVNEAFFIIDTHSEGIPFEAIKYLRDCFDSKKVTDKIVFALEYAYDNDAFYDYKKDVYYEAPLWYAIVAEKHLSKDLIDPIINLFITTNNDSDFLNEQGMYVLGMLAEKYPDLVVGKVMRIIDKMIKNKSDFPYLFLFDALYYADVKKYKNWFLKTLEKDDFYWKDNFVHHVADLKIKEAIPIIKDIIDKKTDEYSIIEFEESLKELETGIVKYPEVAKPYFKRRDDWEEYYSGFEDRFYENECDDECCDCGLQIPERVEKTGRNEPCPCGSGKKYKKCCMEKDNF